MNAALHLTAALSGRYTIERELGRGGMATVYLAHDVRHDRRVAIKVLDPELGAVIGAERFLAEIRVTANLQHPNLLALFDSGEADGLLYYVMPYVEGETLRAKLARERQLPIDEAVRIAVAVSGALDYAHRQGVIHRDLKPENILLHEGQPMVADFGIALAVSNAGGSRITQTGLSLGTPQYMSPEQATGDRGVDGRTDVYSLGAVLYEMLTGAPPHTGPTAQAVIARVLTENPRDARGERPSVPEHVQHALDRALAKVPADRWPTARDFADALGPDAAGRGAPWARRPKPHRSVTLAVGSAAAGGFIVAGLAALFLSRYTATHSGSGTARLGLSFGADQRLTLTANGNTLAISRDGRMIAAVGAGRDARRAIYLRSLADPHARLLEGTQGAERPFFSPDGKWLGFAVGRKLMKVAIEGGAPSVVGEIESPVGAAWLTPDRIVLPLHNALAVMPASGGAAHVFAHPDSAHGEIGQRWPLALPDGNTVLYAAWFGSVSKSRIAVASLSDGTSTVLDVPGTAPLGVIGGSLVYVGVGGSLMAVPFDAAKRRTTGTAIAFADRPLVGPIGSSNAALSLNGTLVYQTGSFTEQVAIARPGAVDRILVAEPRTYSYPRLSPDAKRVALTVSDNGRSDVWLYATEGGTLTRLTTDGTANDRPEWTPDGSSILYRSNRDGGSSLWRIPADGSGPPSLFFALPGIEVWEGVLSPDGQTLVYRTGSIGTGDIFFRRMSGDTAAQAIANTSFAEWTPRLSPDGRWIAYASDESGAYQVYVRPFPGLGGRLQISVDGGEMPVWSRDGQRLYFIEDQYLTAADLSFAPTLHVTGRTKVMESELALPARGHAGFDVLPDGRSILELKPVSDNLQMIVVINWTDELRAALAKTR